MKALRFLARSVRENGLFWAINLIWRRITVTATSKILAKAFNAPKITISGKPNIRGIKFIKFGESININGDIWLEAVTNYAGVSYQPAIKIGNKCAFSDKVHISGIRAVSIGEGCLFGSKVFVADHDHGVYRGELQSAPSIPPAARALGFRGDVRIGSNVWIGENAVLLGPLELGDGCIIGANSVVTGTFPPRSMVAGAPARIIKEFNESTDQWMSV